jgi:hypothetical protein
MPADFQVVVDCSAPHDLADWWAVALGWAVEPSDEEFIRSMIAQSYATDSDTTTHRGVLVWKTGAAIRNPDGPMSGPGGRRILFQLVPEQKTVKNRLHLDIRVGQDNVESESQRLIAAGATFLHRGSEGPNRWVTLADPEGNEFCVT